MNFIEESEEDSFGMRKENPVRVDGVLRHDLTRDYEWGGDREGYQAHHLVIEKDGRFFLFYEYYSPVCTRGIDYVGEYDFDGIIAYLKEIGELEVKQ
jgi:hypothetical protein